MKPYSLSFYSNDLEIIYQKHLMQNHLTVFGRNLLFFGVMSCAIAVYSFILDMKMNGFIALTYGLLVAPIIYFTTTKFPQYFDIFCFVFQSSIIIAIPALKFFNLISRPIQDAESFLTGQLSSFIILSYNLGSRFPLKAMAILFNILVQCILKIIEQDELTCLFFIWFGCNSIILNYVYWQDRIQKEGFLTKHNEKLWLKQVGVFAQISIMTIVYDKGQLQLDINKCNDILLKEFHISCIESFKQYLNSVILIPKQQFNQQILKDMRSQIKSKKFINLHNIINKLHEKTQGQQHEYVGLFDNCIYNVQIFTTWIDESLNIHTLMTKSQNHTDNEYAYKLNYERRLFSDYRIQFYATIKKIFLISKQSASRQGGQKIYQQLKSEFHNTLRMNHNIQLFFYPQYRQQKTEFFLLPLMEQINAITITSIPEPLKLVIKCFIEPGIKLFSCQKTIFHIMLNLFALIVRKAEKSGYIIVNARQKLDRKITYICFAIATDIKSTQDLIDNQNYKEKISRQNKKIHCQDKKIGLEMTVSEYLISKIGPQRRIKFTNFSEDRQMMCFNIYKDLKILEH